MTSTEVSREQRDEWEEQAFLLIESGNSDSAVVAHLRRLGCPPGMAMLMVKSCRATVTSHHRRAGAKGMGLGIALLAGGLLLMLLLSGAIPIAGWRVGSLKGVLVGGAVALTGVTWLLIGLYKSMTGSMVEIEEP